MGVMADKMTAEPEARLFVGGLGWATTNESFAAYFGTFGKLVEAFVVLHKVTGVPRGFGFVWFQDVAVADSVLRMEHVLDGRKLELKKSLAKDPLKHGTSASSGHLTGHQGPPPAMMEKAGHEGMRDANVSVGALSTQMGMLTLQRDISGTTTLSNEREGEAGQGQGQGGASGQGGQAGAQGGGSGPAQDMHGHVSMQHMLFDPTTGQPIPSPYGLPAGYDMGGAGMLGGMPGAGGSPMTGGAHMYHPYGAAAHHHPAYAPPVAGYRAVPGAVYAGYAPHAYAVAPHQGQGAYGPYPGTAGPHMAYAASPYGRTPQGYALPPPYGGMPPPGYALASPPSAYAAGLPAAYTGPVPKAYDSLPPGTLATNIPQAMAAKAAAASVAAKAAAGGSGGGTGSPLQAGQAPSGSEGGSPSLAGSSRGGPQGAVMIPPPYGAYPDAYAAAFGYPPGAGYPGYGSPHPAATSAPAAASHSAAGAQASAAHAQHSAHTHGHGHGSLPTTSPITRTPSGGSGAAGAGQPRHMHADSRKVFVGGLPATITEADFRSYFSRYGTLVDCVVMVDRETGRSRGFGFITYDTESGADLVLTEKHMLHGKIVDCKRAEPKVEHIVAAGSLGATMALSAGGPTQASVGPARAAAVSGSSGVPAAGPAGSPGAAGAAVAPAAGSGGAGVGVGHGGSTAGLYKLSGMADAVSSWRTASSGRPGTAAGAAHPGDAGVSGQPGAGSQANSGHHSQAQGSSEQGHGQEQRQAGGQQQQFAFSMGILGINPDEQLYPYHPDGGFDNSAQ